MERSSSFVSTGPAAKSQLKARAQRILDTQIEFIPSDEFEGMLARKACLEQFEPVPTRTRRSNRKVQDAKALACLAPALAEPLLSFAEEQHEFCRMNFLKFVAFQLRSSLSPHRPSLKKLEEIENSLAEAIRVRDHIIRTNLRLVISNAGKYASPTYGFEDLVSDGSLALMEAVEKFDYQRGFRFSTYATHAIRRSFFRKIERRQRDRQRFVATDPDVMSITSETSDERDDVADHRLIEQILETMGDHLTERELQIVEGRFGLNGRSEPRTLMELSGELGICKERVRQVEGQALRKLHAATLVPSDVDQPEREVQELTSA